MRENDRHEEIIRKIYDNIASGDVESVLADCADEVAFHVPGANELSGTYGRSDFAQFMTRIIDLSGSTFRQDVLDVMVGATHAAVLLHSKLERDGETRGYVTLHLWEFDAAGKPVEWREFPRDLVAFDEIWS